MEQSRPADAPMEDPKECPKLKKKRPPPTACIEFIFITAVVKAYEERDISLIDISGAFFQTEASDGKIIKLQRTVVATLLKINPI